MAKCPKCAARKVALHPKRFVSVMSATPAVEEIVARSELDGWTLVALEALYGTLIVYDGNNPVAEFRAEERARARAGDTLIGISLVYEMNN